MVANSHGLRAALIWLMALSLSAGAGLAGPWPRGAGSVFFSSEFVLDRIAGGANRLTHQHYLEYGVSDTLTLGATLEQQTDWDAAPQVPPMARFFDMPLRGTVFMRLHLGQLTPDTPFALEVQLAHNPAQDEDRLRIAAHLGHGFAVMGKDAWARVSASAAPFEDADAAQRDISAQLGVRMLPRLRGWVDAGAIFADGARTARVSVTAAVDVTDHLALTLGYSRAFGGWRETGWRVGVWSEF